MTRRRRRRGITPWKKTALKVCALWLILAAGIHLFRILKAYGFHDQREASRWGNAAPGGSAQVSAFLPAESSLKQEDVRELEYKINTALAQDSIKITSEDPDARLWQDCFSGVGSFTITAGKKTVDAEAVGTGGAFFTFHPLELSSGAYYQSDSLMKDEILLDQESAWKLFGSFNVTGRTVQVGDLHLRIAGVYKKGEGSLYEKGGLAEYVAFVQYKTLLQCGGSGAGDSGSGQDAQGTSSIPNTAAIPAAAAATEDVEIDISSDPESGAGAGEDTSAAEIGAGTAAENGTGTASESGSAGTASESGSAGTAAESGSGTEDSTETGTGAGAGKTANMENVGTSNTAYRDTGMITTYEIVMPNPVEGYAAAVVKTALGEDSGAVVVDNTNRYEIRNLFKDIREFALLGMRTRGVRYPYWENVAMGWETIFAALFLLECVLILLTVLLLLWMLIHWYRHKAWTLAGTIRSIQDSAYERQSRKRYPEYYREREEDGAEDVSARDGSPPQAGVQSQKGSPVQAGGQAQADARAQTKNPGQNTESGLLEDKGAAPFEKIPENRKAVQYETIYQNDQRSDGGGADSDDDGLRRRQQQ